MISCRCGSSAFATTGVERFGSGEFSLAPFGKAVVVPCGRQKSNRWWTPDEGVATAGSSGKQLVQVGELAERRAATAGLCRVGVEQRVPPVGGGLGAEHGFVEVPRQGGLGCHRVGADGRLQTGLHPALSYDHRDAFYDLFLAWVVPAPESPSQTLEIATGTCQLLGPCLGSSTGPDARPHKHPAQMEIGSEVFLPLMTMVSSDTR